VVEVLVERELPGDRTHVRQSTGVQRGWLLAVDEGIEENVRVSCIPSNDLCPTKK
jgi:hypothetical protein